MPNLHFEGSTEAGWVCKMPFPEIGAAQRFVFEGPHAPTTEEAQWGLWDAMAAELAEYREIKEMAGASDGMRRA